MDTDDHKSPFFEWIRSPQTMIALSAIILSVCGLFLSIYETSLIRQQQRASVWPNVEIAPSINPGVLRIFVQNTGVGPARIIKASASYRGEVMKFWNDVIDSFEYDEEGNSSYLSLIKGRVLPPGSSQELIFRIESSSENPDSNLAYQLSSAIRTEQIEIKMCYCSVYDECWTAYMSDVQKRATGEQVLTRDEKKVRTCSAMEESGI